MAEKELSPMQKMVAEKLGEGAHKGEAPSNVVTALSQLPSFGSPPAPAPDQPQGNPEQAQQQASPQEAQEREEEVVESKPEEPSGGAKSWEEIIAGKLEDVQDLSPKARDKFDHIKQDRDKYRTQSQEYEERIAQLEAKLQEQPEAPALPEIDPQEVEQSQQRIEELQSKLEQYQSKEKDYAQQLEDTKRQLAAYDLSTSDEFVQKYNKPLEDLFNESKEILSVSEMGPELIDKFATALTAKTDADYHRMVGSITEELPDHLKYQFSGVSRDVRRLYKEREGAIANHEETSRQFVALKRNRAKAQSEEMLSRFDQYRAQNDRQQEQLINFFKSDQVKEATGFDYDKIVNNSVQEGVESIRNVLTKQTVDDSALKTVYKAAQADVFLEALKTYANEYQALQVKYQDAIKSLEGQKAADTTGGVENKRQEVGGEEAPKPAPKSMAEFIASKNPNLKTQEVYSAYRG